VVVHIEMLYVKLKVLLFKKYTKKQYAQPFLLQNTLDTTSKDKKEA